jgi:hypothetical protein
VAAVYGSDRELERVQSAARSRDSQSVSGENKRIREIFRKTPKERVNDDSRITPRPGNTAREGMLLAGTSTPPARIRDRANMGSDYKPISHGISAPTRPGLELARISNDSLKEFESQEREWDRLDRDKWDKAHIG